MRIQILKPSICGKVLIPAGDYWVSLQSDIQMIVLSGAGKDIKLPATRRRTKTHGRTTTVSFYCGGGTSWSLVVSVPKLGEWLALIEQMKESREEERRRRPS